MNTHTGTPESEGRASEAKLNFLTAYQESVIGLFDELIQSNPVGKENIRAALQEAFQKERQLTTTHTNTIGGLVGNIDASEKKNQRISKKILEANERVITYLQELTSKILNTLGEEATLEDFTKALDDEIHRINPLGGSSDRYEENKLIDMYMDRLLINHESLVSHTRKGGNTIISTAPKNEIKKPHGLTRGLYAIPLAFLALETYFSTLGVGQRFLTSAEASIHNEAQGKMAEIYHWLQENGILVGSMYAGALASSIIINKLLQKASTQIVTHRKAQAIREKTKEKKPEELLDEVANAIKNKNFPKKRRMMIAVGCMLAASYAIGDFVWSKHRQGKLIEKVGAKVAGSQIPGILQTTEQVRSAVSAVTADFPEFASKAKNQGNQWLADEGASGKGPGFYAKSVVIEGSDSTGSRQLGALRARGSSQTQKILAGELSSMTETFGGGDAAAATGFTEEFAQIAKNLQTPSEIAINEIDTLTAELIEMENTRKFDREKIIEIVKGMGDAVQRFGEAIDKQQGIAGQTAQIYADFIKEVNDRVNAAYSNSTTRAQTTFTPDTILPTIDTAELISKLQASVPEFKYYTPDEIDGLLSNRDIFTESEANKAKNHALGFGITIEILFRAIAFLGAGWLAKRAFAKNLTPDDHIAAEKSLDELADAMSLMTKSETFVLAYPHIASYSKGGIRDMLVKLIEKWREKREKESKKSEHKFKRGVKIIAKPFVGFKKWISEVRPDQDRELENLRSGFDAIRASDDPKILDRGFVEEFFEELLGNPGDAKELAEKLETMQRAQSQRITQGEPEKLKLTKGERKEIDESQKKIRKDITLVIDRLSGPNGVIEQLKGLPGSDVEKVEAWGQRVMASLSELQKKIGQNEVLTKHEERMLESELGDINTEITQTDKWIRSGRYEF